MKSRKKFKAKDLSRNVQFENAFNWLRAMKIVKTAKELAAMMGESEGTISTYLNMIRPVSPRFIMAFEEKVLHRQKPPCNLKDFELEAMNIHTKQLQKQDMINMMEMLTTQVTWLEGGVRIMLDKLDKLERQNKALSKKVGELQALSKNLNP
jgi:transcriptional regulator with XRE-family HTH domain